MREESRIIANLTPLFGTPIKRLNILRFLCFSHTYVNIRFVKHNKLLQNYFHFSHTETSSIKQCNITENNIPVGANVWRNRLFITVPRRQLGIPSTLNYVSLDNKVKHNVRLISYPNWKLNLYPPDDNINDHFVSMYRIAIDPCDRLWAIDTGILESRGKLNLIFNWIVLKLFFM